MDAGASSSLSLHSWSSSRLNISIQGRPPQAVMNMMDAQSPLSPNM